MFDKTAVSSNSEGQQIGDGGVGGGRSTRRPSRRMRRAGGLRTGQSGQVVRQDSGLIEPGGPAGQGRGSRSGTFDETAVSSNVEGPRDGNGRVEADTVPLGGGNHPATHLPAVRLAYPSRSPAACGGRRRAKVGVRAPQAGSVQRAAFRPSLQAIGITLRPTCRPYSRLTHHEEPWCMWPPHAGRSEGTTGGLLPAHGGKRKPVGDDGADDVAAGAYSRRQRLSAGYVLGLRGDAADLIGSSRRRTSTSLPSIKSSTQLSTPRA